MDLPTRSLRHPLRVVFMGTPDFAVPSLLAIFSSENLIAVVTPPDRPSGRGMTLKPPAIKVEAEKRSLPLYQTERIRKDSVLIQSLADLAPDVIVVVAFGQILPDAVLKIAPCINLHASLLPKFRGASPIQSAVISGAKETGVTTMMLDAGMDTGEILLQQSIAIDSIETAETVSVRLATLGAELLIKTLTQFKMGQLIPIPQKETDATLTTLLTKEDGFIRWADSAEAIFNRWRGTVPWPGTTTFCWNADCDGEEQWKIISLEIGASEGQWGKPGEVLKVSGDGLEVAVGIGSIIITRLKLPGGKEILPTEYAASRPLLMGSIFHTVRREI